jgi:hypothetical protein
MLIGILIGIYLTGFAFCMYIVSVDRVGIKEIFHCVAWSVLLVYEILGGIKS